MQLSNIIGATIATTGYEELAQEAARRFRRHTGCHALILTADGRDGYDLKFEIPRLAGGRVFCFFDADLWFIRDVSLDRFAGMEGAALVPDPAALHPTFCQNDADVLGLPRERYCNTGLIIANSADSRVLTAFDRASVLMAEKRAGLHPDIQDTTEQSMLNRALFENQLPTQFLLPKWNSYYYAIPNGFIDSIPVDMLAIHAAGVPLEKKIAYLELQARAHEANMGSL